MKAAVFRAPGHVEVCEIAEPRPRAREILVEVHACGICGTDTLLYRSGAFRQSAGTLQMNADGLEILGHEATGRIVALGEDVRGWQIGEPVLAITGGGGMAERLTTPLSLSVVRIPPQLDYASAVAAVPLAYALQMIRLADPRPGENLVVIGAGIVGLCLIELLRKRQASLGKLIAVDMFEERLQMARELGANHAIHTLQEDVVAKAGRYCGWSHMPMQRRCVPEVAVVFDCAGHAARRVIPPPLQQSLALLSREGGRIISFAPYESAISLDMIDLIHKQARVIGSLGFVQEDLVDALDMLAKGLIDPRRMTEGRLPMNQAPAGFEMQASGDAFKVIIEPQA